jgi:hypothetical protein
VERQQRIEILFAGALKRQAAARDRLRQACVAISISSVRSARSWPITATKNPGLGPQQKASGVNILLSFLTI